MSPVTRHVLAFTIVELLTVIAIIAILAAMLLPALAAAKVHAQKTQAKLQASQIVDAIQKYDSDYSRMPVPDAAQTAASSSNCYTFGGGGIQTPTGPWTPTAPAPNYFASNSDVVAILMNMTNFPGGGTVMANAGFQKNPQQNIFLNAKMVSATNIAGVGPDLNYRDPWKNPYVITIDVSDDNACSDPFYGSVGGDGLVRQANGSYTLHGNVMVWSAGPDGKIDPAKPADQDVNKDNIVSWQ